MRRLAMLPLLAGLVGCHSSHDVTYYSNHASERDQLVAQCQNDPGSSKDDSDCVNAIQAKSNDMFSPGAKGHASIGKLPSRDK